MKAPFKILTTTAVAGALVAAGIAGAAPANAAANPDVTVQGVITLQTTVIAVPALTPSTPLLVNTNTGSHGSLELWVVVNGAVVDAGPVFQDAAGNASVDVIKELGEAAFNTAAFGYGVVPAGTYQAYLTEAATTDYGYPTQTNFLAAQSPTLTLAVSKVKTSISGFSTKTKKIKHGAYLSKKVDKFTVANAAGAKVTLQYKKKGGKWKNVNSVTTSLYSTSSTKLTDGYRYNQALKSGGKSYPRGTQYFRILVKATGYSSGAKSKAFKFVVK